jgi:protein-S-isoprenylcysteine O-methyltransferase Ste14
MSTLVVVLRVVPLLALPGAMLLAVNAHREGMKARARPRGNDRAPVVANFGAFGLFVVSLLMFSGSSTAAGALLLAASGSLLALAGVAVVVRSRAALGAAWSFVPRADQVTGLVTTGPYRLVRHPIYLGLALHSLGEALAFASWPATTIVVCGVVPTLVWRARLEERLIGRLFGEGYDSYRTRTKMIKPHVL